jgi:hypothetical protein
MPRFGGYPPARITVRKITPLIQANTPTGLQVVLEDEQSRLHNIDINSPYRRGIVSFVLKDLGIAPLVIMHDAAGKELDGAFVKLNVVRGKEDGFKMGPTDFKVKFYPDYEMVEGEDRSRSEEFRNPVFVVQARKGESITSHRIPCVSGASIKLDGLTYEFAKFSYWVRFTVVSEQGVPLVYAGFFIACVGLLWRLGWYRREIAGTLDKDEQGNPLLILAFRAEFYRALAGEEFEVLQRRLLWQLKDKEDDYGKT